jgi:glycosyltransferase involved in cell wall biosynthesis
MSLDSQRKKTLTVALLGSRGIPARYGGFETVVEELVNHLPKDRFRIYVACESSMRGLGSSPSNVRTLYFPVIEKLRMISEVAYDALSLSWSAFATLDVVLLFGYAASPFCLLPRLLGKTVVVNVDGLEWKRRKFPRFVRWALRAAEMIVTRAATILVCDSRAIGAYYLQRYGVDSVFIPNPGRPCVTGNSESLREFGLQPGGYYSVVARLEPENNIDVIIEGFKKSGSRRKLVIVGPLYANTYVESLPKMRNERVIFLGGVYDRRKLGAIRNNSYAYIHGQEVGGTSPSLLESMACGTAILSLDVSFNREVAQDSALYFANAAELAEKIAKLEGDPTTVRKMGKRAAEIARRQYSISLVVSRYAELLSRGNEKTASK